MCSEFFSFSPCITRRQNFYFLPRLSNQENSVLQGNKVSYSIESWKWGIFRQRQLFCNRKISSVLGCPAFSTGFPHSTVCSPSGRGGHFCPSTSLWLISGQKCPPLPSWQHTVSWGKPVLHAGPPTTFSFSPCSRAFSLSTLEYLIEDPSRQFFFPNLVPRFMLIRWETLIIFSTNGTECLLFP